MRRIVCHTGSMTADDLLLIGASYSPRMSSKVAPVLTPIEQIARRLAAEEWSVFRFEGFERQRVLWNRVGPEAAIVVEWMDDSVRCVHLLSRGPTREIWWEKRIESNSGDDGGLLGLLVLVPAFAEWTSYGRSQAPQF